MLQPLVSIITVNYNELEVTCELLDSIRRNSYSNMEVIVVDNASKANPVFYLNKNYPEVKVIRSGRNLGFAGGNNLGIEASKGEYLFFVNSDAELTDGVIETLLALFERNPKLGIVSPLLCYHNENPENEVDIIQYAGTTPVHPLTARNETLGELEEDHGQYREALPTAYVHGAAMMTTREVLNKAGRMSERFFLYYEELDWCEKIRRAGFEIYIEPNAKIYHKESISVSKINTLKTYYLNRNRILFMRRNKSALELAAFILFLIFATIPKNALVFILKGQFDHLKAFLKAIRWHITGQDGIKIPSTYPSENPPTVVRNREAIIVKMNNE